MQVVFQVRALSLLARNAPSRTVRRRTGLSDSEAARATIGRPEDLAGGRQPWHGQNEVFPSELTDENPFETLLQKVSVARKPIWCAHGATAVPPVRDHLLSTWWSADSTCR